MPSHSHTLILDQNLNLNIHARISTWYDYISQAEDPIFLPAAMVIILLNFLKTLPRFDRRGLSIFSLVQVTMAFFVSAFTPRYCWIRWCDANLTHSFSHSQTFNILAHSSLLFQRFENSSGVSGVFLIPML